ncbi:phospholipase D-like domain-containing protein [Methanobacterium sp. ACI-7]|uniref:phospholipase D-like domain-containing protein n=1 Tax=unclassified Methanobacterium TaxID=2627676 RepID=UPI0039C2A478
MENIILNIYGKVVDENKNPISDLKLKAYAINSSFFHADEELGESKSDSEGDFNIVYDLGNDLEDKKSLEIKIEVFIENDNLLSISKSFKGNDINFETIKIEKPNIGIEGRVIDENGNPISRLTVVAEDVDFGKIELNALELIESKVKSAVEKTILSDSFDFIKDRYNLLFFMRDDFLGSTKTDENGYYRIIYHPSKYKEILDKDPDIRVIVKDNFGVFELKKTETYENVSKSIQSIENIVINRKHVEGWHVTLKDSIPSRLSQNNDIEILIDNNCALEKIVSVIEEAESYVYLTQFNFYPDFVPRFFNSPDNPSEYKSDDPLAYKLLEAQNRGVDTKIIINENAVVPDNYDELHDYFKDSEVEVRRFPAKGPYAMHAKVLVADGKKGLIIGSPFSQSYWDTTEHDVDEPRRLDKNEGPVHDVSIYLEGSAVNDVEEFFIEIWNYLSDLHFDGEGKLIKNSSLFRENEVQTALNKIKEQKNNSNIQSDYDEIINNQNSYLRSENETLQIVRSITPDTLTNSGEMGVLEAYRKAINNAKDFIYLENQYFTNKYIIGALKRALNRNEELQLIMVINEVPDVPTYRSWQHYGFDFLELDVKKMLLENQIGVFVKWSGKFQNGKNKLRNCYIHSKVAIVDDVWATIGTSNIDGSSLSCAEEFGSTETSVNHRNMEMNALMFDINDQKKGSIERFRQMLWSEHLGTNISTVNRPEEGWLNLWKNVAYTNISKLEKEEIVLNGGILPYSKKTNRKDQIKDLVEQYRRIKGRFNR